MKMTEPYICDCMKSDGETVPVCIDGKTVGIARLNSAVESVRNSGLTGTSAADELLALVKKYNYIPPKAEEAYRKALLAYYQKVTVEKGGLLNRMKKTFSSGGCCCGVRIVEKKEDK